MPLNYLWFAAVVGVLVYAVSTNGKAAEIGRVVFWTALLAIFLGR